MKKNAVFSALLLIVGILLFLLKATGITAHIVLSVVGLVLLIVYTVMTKKQWKIPALEIIMRVVYAIALITGVVVVNVQGVAAVALVHRICAAIFVLLLVILFVQKALSKSK